MVKLLIISLGSIGQRHLRNARELLPEAEIAVYRQHFRSNKALPEAADKTFFELDEALDFKPDAVVISSPASEHVRNAIDFIKNGAHLFIEKPLAVNHEDVGELVELSRDSDCFAMVGYVLRFQPILHFIRHLIHSGDLGEIRTANVEVGQYLPDWRPDSDYRKGVSAQKALGGGALLELSHELDYATWLFGIPDHIICSSGKISDLEIDVEDSACVIMEYGRTNLTKRVVVQVDFLQRRANMAVRIVGSEATFYADLIKEQGYIVSPVEDEPRCLDVPKMTQANEMYLRQFDFFFARSFAGYVPRFSETREFTEQVTVDRAASVLKLVDVARESNNQGARLKFEG